MTIASSSNHGEPPNSPYVHRPASVDYNKVTNILPSIRHIEFNQLAEVKIRGNCIYSIEGIHIMKWPNLESLWIDDNFITRITQLTKSRL